MNMNSLPFILPLLTFLEASRYFLLFGGSYLEGTVVMLAGGMLWHEGLVSFWPAYGALMLGDFLSDMMWYCIGYYAARPFIARWGHWFGVTPAIVEKITRRFHHYHMRILIISKLTMGFGLAVGTLMTAGMLRLSLTRYIVINVLGGIVWIFCIMLVGYYFGNVLQYIPEQLKIAGGIAVVVGFFFGVRALSRTLATSKWE